jgi:hypothetical protein
MIDVIDTILDIAFCLWLFDCLRFQSVSSHYMWNVFLNITYVWTWRKTLFFSFRLPPNYFLPSSSSVFFLSFPFSSNLFVQWQSNVLDIRRISLFYFLPAKGILSSTDRSDCIWVPTSFPCIFGKTCDRRT